MRDNIEVINEPWAVSCGEVNIVVTLEMDVKDKLKSAPLEWRPMWLDIGAGTRCHFALHIIDEDSSIILTYDWISVSKMCRYSEMLNLRRTANPRLVCGRAAKSRVSLSHTFDSSNTRCLSKLPSPHTNWQGGVFRVSDSRHCDSIWTWFRAVQLP